MDEPRRLVLDAGPLIALFHAKDPDHSKALDGFRRLVRHKTRLVTPLPVVFEVYKWLLFQAGPETARKGLKGLVETLEIEPLDLESFVVLQASVQGLPGWRGSLEDASVALLALRLKAPVWTFNYRDLGVFKGLSFWNG